MLVKNLLRIAFFIIWYPEEILMAPRGLKRTAGYVSLTNQNLRGVPLAKCGVNEG